MIIKLRLYRYSGQRSLNVNQFSDSSFALDISQSFTTYESLMPIISMNLMETLLQNEYTKCNESIPYKTFDHYTVTDSKAFFTNFLNKV